VPRLLLDLTPLDTPSGPRGIGRYIRELALGLSELPPEELEGVEIIGLTSLEWTGEYKTTRDIASYRGGPRSVADVAGIALCADAPRGMRALAGDPSAR